MLTPNSPISVSVPNPCYRRSTEKDPGHAAKRASGRFQLNARAPTFVASNGSVNLCRVVWCTQTLRRDGSSLTWHQSRNNQTAMQPRRWIFKNVLCKAAFTHSESHTTKAQWVRLEAENSAIVATAVKADLKMRPSKSAHTKKSS